MSEKETLIIRIKKLLDKANSTDSIHEKTALMAKAQELLQTYNLEIETITSFDADGKKITEERISYSDFWEAQLMHIICSNNFATSFRVNGTDKICVIAQTNNISVITYMFSFFRNAVLNLSLNSYQNLLEEKKKQLTEIGININDFKKQFNDLKKTHMEDFINGAVSGISAKLREQKREAERSNSNLTALILRNGADLSKYMERYKIRQGRARKVRVSDAYNEGYRAGKNINMNSGVGGSNNNKLIS